MKQKLIYCCLCLDLQIVQCATRKKQPLLCVQHYLNNWTWLKKWKNNLNRWTWFKISRFWNCIMIQIVWMLFKLLNLTQKVKMGFDLLNLIQEGEVGYILFKIWVIKFESLNLIQIRRFGIFWTWFKYWECYLNQWTSNNSGRICINKLDSNGGNSTWFIKCD